MVDKSEIKIILNPIDTMEVVDLESGEEVDRPDVRIKAATAMVEAIKSSGAEAEVFLFPTSLPPASGEDQRPD